MSGVESPCVSVCKLDAQGVCTGCGRSIDEIQLWPRAGDAQRRAIRDAAARRLSIMDSSIRTEPRARR